MRELMDSKDLIMTCERIRAFRRVPHTQGMGRWFGDMLFGLAEETTSNCIVELGTFHGRGTILLARGARAGNGAKVYTIDDYTQKRGWTEEFYGPLDKEIFKANIRKAGVEVTLINKEISEAAQNWTEPIGLLYWDLGAKNRFWQDWLDWNKHIVRGGVAIVKDTANSDLGATEKIDTIVEAGIFERESFRGGVTVLRRIK